jgi:hypothetical protein
MRALAGTLPVAYLYAMLFGVCILARMIAALTRLGARLAAFGLILRLIRP